MLEEIVSPDNMVEALKQVRRNKGSAGVDHMTTAQMNANKQEIFMKIRKEILSGTFKPKPVKRVEIPKPDGGVRMLGVPTVIDRWVQQAISQILSRHYEPQFSKSSYGFRPKRSAHQAVKKAKEYIAAGNRIVVDIDLEKFFDSVNHDKLMHLMSLEIKDKRVLRLIRKFLLAGIMVDGLFTCSEKGTPQGGNLSPLLSNVMLNELDKELEKRGHKFVRYADDCNIYVRSQKAGERVKKTVTTFLEKKLRLKVNEAKSAVDKPQNRKFLGFSFGHRKDKTVYIRVAAKSIVRFKEKVRVVLRKMQGGTLKEILERYKRMAAGWVNYFGLAETKELFKTLDEYVRHKIRAMIWKRWKRYGTRVRNLVKLGVNINEAKKTASSGKGCWRLSNTPAINMALTNERLKRNGVYFLTDRWAELSVRQ